MLRRIVLALLIAGAPTLSLAQSRGTSQFDALVVTGSVAAGSVVTPALKLGAFTLTGVGTTSGTVAAGNDSRIVGAAQNSAAAITGGTINGTTIGGTTPAAGAFTTLSATTPLPAASGGTGYGSVSGALDGLFSPVQGALLYRGSAGWQGLAPGTSGQVLTTSGPGANPSWTTVGGGGGASTVMQPQGRLTLTSGAPVMTSAVSAATSVLYTPYTGTLVPLWNGAAFAMTACAETTQALSDTTKSPSAAAAAQVYDYFAWNDGGTCRVTRGPAWSAGTSGSNTVRGTGPGSTALTRVSGLLTNSVAITNGPAAGYGVYVGTIATDGGTAAVSWVPGSSAAGGGAAVFNVWNAYNRVSIETQVIDTSASTTYASSTIRSLNGSNSNRVSFVRGLDEEGTSATIEVTAQVAANDQAAYAGIGLDTTSAWTSPAGLGYAPTYRWGGTIFASYRGRPGLGVHYLQALQGVASGGTANYGGSQGEALSFSGRF